MEEWKECKLGDLCIDNKGSYGIAASAVPYSENLYTYLRITDINDDGTLNKSDLKSVADENAEQYILQPNDIVFARTGGSTGRNYFDDGSDGVFVYAGFLIKFSIDPSKVNPKYIKYFCLSQEYKNWVYSFNTGSTRGNINAQTYANMPVILPPRSQQDLLVKTLSSLDDKIELNNKINANLEQQAGALFRNWFVDFEPFGGKMPEGWKECKAEEYFEITIGKTPPRKEQEWFSEEKTNQTMKWVSISDMGSCGLFISDSSEYLTTEAVAKYNVKVVPANTIILSFKLTVGRIAITDDEMCTNEAIAHFGTKNKVINEYLYLYLKNFNYQTMGSTSSIATAVNSKIIKAMPFILPDEKTINDFHLATNSLFEKIRENQHENSTLSTIRDTLLPKLMNGEIEVGIK